MRVAAFISLMALVTLPVFTSAQVELSSAEIDRYLTGSGMRKVIVNAHNMAVTQALRQGQLTNPVADCFRSGETVSSYLEQVLHPLVARSFRTTTELEAAIQFNESPAGRKIVRHVELAQDKALAAFFRGEAPPPLAPMSFTESEASRIQRWEASPEFAAVRRLDAAMREMRSTLEHQSWLVASKKKCSA